MTGLPLLLFFFAQVEVVPSGDFSRTVQTTAITATVRLVNVAQKSEGSGVLLGRKEKKDKFVYVLTARHLIRKAERLEVSTFSAETYPRPSHVYEATLVAATSSLRDLALLRIETQDKLPASLALCPAKSEPEGKPFAALSVGCGDRAPPTCLIDQVLGSRKVQRKMEPGTASFWEVDRKQAPGRSGGPLVDRNGHLLGICSGINKEKSYFADLEELRAFLKPHGFE